MTHAGLRCEMHDPINASISKRVDDGSIRKIHLLEGEPIVSLQPLEPTRLEGWVVVVIERINAQHIITTRQQGRGNVISNEPGSSGDEDLHGGNLEGASGIIATPTTRGVPTMVRNRTPPIIVRINRGFEETNPSSRP